MIVKQRCRLHVSLMVFTATVCSVGSAHALTMPTVGGPSEHARHVIAEQKHIRELSRSTAPFAHVLFCTKSPRECMRSKDTPAAIPLDQTRKDELEAVNNQVNRQIRPRNDGGFDTWTLNPKTGDCEDFAITKRHLLIEKGWPTSVLRLAMGYTSGGEGHLVLIVRATSGDFVLNNLTNEILPYQNAGLSWQMIQSSRDPKIWYRMSR
jgi:predicted transglutaminase-like cysteine proteinase